MAKKSVSGQMDMFELFESVEELEENIKGVPEIEIEESEIEEADMEEPVTEAVEEVIEMGEQVKSRPQKIQTRASNAVMHRSFRSRETGCTAVIAYLDYNMVYLQDWEGDPVIYQFLHSKDAVDFYVQRMEQFSSDKKVEVLKEQEALKEASVIKWTGDRDNETGRIES